MLTFSSNGDHNRRIDDGIRLTCVSLLCPAFGPEKVCGLRVVSLSGEGSAFEPDEGLESRRSRLWIEGGRYVRPILRLARTPPSTTRMLSHGAITFAGFAGAPSIVPVCDGGVPPVSRGRRLVFSAGIMCGTYLCRKVAEISELRELGLARTARS